MNRGAPIRTEADIRAVEQGGLDAFLPAPSPVALLRRAAASWPGACAIRYLPAPDQPDETIAFAALFAQVQRAASVLRRLGVGPGRPAALFLPNTLNGQVALWAAGLAGGVCPINPVLSGEQVTALLKASAARVAVVLGVNPELDVWTGLASACRAAGIATVLDCDADAECPGSDGSFAALVAAEPSCAWPDPDPDSIVALYPTGGTTGLPKLTLHTHRNEAFVANAAARLYDLQPGEVMLNGFPLFHVAGAFVYGLSSVAGGATQLVPGRLGMRNRAFTGTLWRQAERYRIAILSAVPTTLSGLLSVPIGDADLGSLRAAYTGGSVLPNDLADASERHAGIPVRNVLGMTECSGMLTTEPFHGPRTPGSTGLRLPFTSVRILRDDGTQAAPGESGTLVIQGPHVSPGYLDPAVGRDTFGPHGLVSGDLGHRDSEGRIFVTGRSKDVIIRGSHNIDPCVIEDALLQHPAVAIAAAIGLPDAYAGELPSAFVTLKPGHAADEAELVSFAATRVPEPAARPKRVWIIDAMPLTPVGKIYKPALRAEAAQYAVCAALASLTPAASVARVSAGPQPSEVMVAVNGLTPAEEARLRAVLTGMPLIVKLEAA